MFYASLLACMGDLTGAVDEAGRAVERDPLSQLANYFLAQSLEWARRYDEAIEQARLTIEVAPRVFSSYWPLAWAAVGKGDYATAIEALQHAVGLEPADPHTEAYVAWVHGLAGRRAQADEALERLTQRRAESHFSSYLLALVNVGIGDYDRAIKWIEVADEEKDPLVFLLSFWWAFDSLRTDSRFQALLRRMNFPETAAST